MSARRQLIAALSEDSMGGIATLQDVDHAEQLVDAYRAEVLAADGQAYDGELAMARGLIRTLRAVVRPDDADMGEVRRLLHHHASDDAAARDEIAKKGTPWRRRPTFTASSSTRSAPHAAPRSRCPPTLSGSSPTQ